MYRILTWSEIITDMRVTVLVNGHCTKNMNNLQLFMCQLSQKYTTVITKQADIPYFGREPKYMLCA